MAKVSPSLYFCPLADRRKRTANSDSWNVEAEMPDLFFSVLTRASVSCLFQFFEKARYSYYVIDRCSWSETKVDPKV